MKRGVFIVLIIIIILISLGKAKNKTDKTLPASVTDIQSLITTLETQLNDMENTKPLSFSGNLFFAHSALIKFFPIDVLTAYADGLIGAGVTRIDINPSADTWSKDDTETIAKYDELVRYIRARGAEIVWNPQYSATEGEIGSFDEWQTETLDAYKKMAERYTPDIFIVAHEPTTMAKRMGKRVSISEWTNFVEEATEVIKDISPDTRVGAGGLFHEAKYLERWSRLANLDIVTINIYDLSKLKTYNAIIQDIKNNNKSVYIEETWRFPVDTSGAKNLEQASAVGIGDAQYQEIDEQWLRVISLYAKVWGLEAVTPFWTQTFFAYGESNSQVSALDPKYNTIVMEAIIRNERTDTWRAYKEIIEELQ